MMQELAFKWHQPERPGDVYHERGEEATRRTDTDRVCVCVLVPARRALARHHAPSHIPPVRLRMYNALARKNLTLAADLNPTVVKGCNYNDR